MQGKNNMQQLICNRAYEMDLIKFSSLYMGESNG